MAQTNLKQSPNQAVNAGGSHSRSLPQSFNANNCLPPLSPFSPSESSLVSPTSNLKNLSMEEVDVSSRGSATSLTSPRENPFCGNSGLPPQKGHRRSNSDVPLGFSAMIQSSPQLVPISSQGFLGQMANTRGKSGKEMPVGLKKLETETFSYGKNFAEEMGERKSEGEVDSSNYESESVLRNGTSSGESLKRNAAGALQTRRYRSLSMDSGIGNYHFGDSSPNLQSSLCNRADQLSPSNSLSENSAHVTLDFGHGEFNEVELKKIKADERLAEIAISDPKRAKRILANRQSASRSKERKLRYISELEHKVQTLQTEATTLSAQITILQKDHAELTNQNNELKFRIHAMEQQAQLRDALHETLTAEVQRLKLANMELREEGRTNGIAQQVPIKHNMFLIQRQQPNQVQRLSVTTSSTSSTASAGPASA